MTLEKYKVLQLSAEHILSDYKRVLKENEQKEELIDRMKKFLLKENKMCDFLESKVKNNIKELKAKYKTALEENSKKAFILKCQITVLQELIEEREEK